MGHNFYSNVISIIKRIPEGKVATYGQIADYAGNKRAARQVAYILHSSWKKEKLPWHRVVNSKGRISLKHGKGYETQKHLLEKEGIIFNSDDYIDMSRYCWKVELEDLS